MFDYSNSILAQSINDILKILMESDHEEDTNKLIHHFLEDIHEDQHHTKIHSHITDYIINPGAFIQDFLDDQYQKHYILKNTTTFEITKSITTNTYLDLNYNGNPINIVSSTPKATIFSGWVEFEKQNGIFDGAASKVNEYSGNKTHQYPKIAMDELGNYIIVWQDNRNANWDVYFQRYNTMGEKIGVNIKATKDAYSQYDPDVSMNDSGEFVISWTSSEGAGDIFCQRFNSDGSFNGSEIHVSNTSSNAQLESAVSLNNSGQFVVTWKYSNPNYWDIYFQQYDENGDRYQDHNNTRITYTDSNDDKADVALNDNGYFVIVWRHYGVQGYLYYRKFEWDWFDPEGYDSGILSLINSSPNQTNPNIVIASDSSFIVAYNYYISGNWDIYYSTWNSDLSAHTEVKVNDDATSTPQVTPRIAMNSNKEFIIVWADARNLIGDVYYQRYDSNENKIGVNLKINEADTIDYAQPCAAINNSNNFSIAWDSRKGGGGYWNIYHNFTSPLKFKEKLISGYPPNYTGYAYKIINILGYAAAYSTIIDISSLININFQNISDEVIPIKLLSFIKFFKVEA